MTGSFEDRLRLALLDLIAASSAPENKKQLVVDRIEAMSAAELLAEFGPTPRERPTFEQLAAVYAARGLAVTRPAGNWSFGRSMVCAAHDGVPYCMDAHPDQSEPDWDRGIRHRAHTIKRHHRMVKAIHEHCELTTGADVWVLCGGGSQLQAFFGNRSGYLAILYLPMGDLDVQWTDSNPVFAGLRVPGVTVLQSTTARPAMLGDVAQDVATPAANEMPCGFKP